MTFDEEWGAEVQRKINDEINRLDAAVADERDEDAVDSAGFAYDGCWDCLVRVLGLIFTEETLKGAKEGLVTLSD